MQENLTAALHKIDVEWGQHPETFECRMYRSEVPDPDDPTKTIIVWRLVTGYDVLTQEGERVRQDENRQLSGTAVTVAEQIRNLVIARIKQKNDIDK